MKHYEFGRKFRTLFDKAVKLYGEGKGGPDTFFDADEKSWLAANGITAQHMYDYAEDHNHSGEPGFEIAVAIESVRRDYFINVQKGRTSDLALDASYLPNKDAEVRGIAWLPRLIPKARAKLHGELPPALMYCCGGDRQFFQEHNIYPPEFLSLVWRHADNDAAVIDWVVRRSATAR